MTPRKPLAEASARLRRRPGRKRAAAARADAPLQVPAAPGPVEAVVPALCPPETRRLLDLAAASTYLGGVSTWTLRTMIRGGALPVVRLSIPTGGRGRPLARLLLDVRDLDALVERSKVLRPEVEPARVARMAHARSRRRA